MNKYNFILSNSKLKCLNIILLTIKQIWYNMILLIFNPLDICIFGLDLNFMAYGTGYPEHKPQGITN
jgi:hypothetical protein